MADADSADTDSADTDSADADSADTDSADADSADAGSCEVPEVIAGCEGVEVPGTDVPGFARGIVVNDDGAVLTFADVNATELLCGGGDLFACQCDDWSETSRFTFVGPLAVGVLAPEQVSLLSAGGDCEAGGAEFDEVVTEVELTAITGTCVAGRVVIEDGLGALPTEFGFVAPRC